MNQKPYRLQDSSLHKSSNSYAEGSYSGTLNRQKFTIITLSYNQRPYLQRAVESVLNQNWTNLEYLVIDPGSTDGSREFLAERFADVQGHLIFSPDRGPAHGLNKGIAIATGDIIGYLNADDAYLPGAFQGAAQAFQQFAEASVVYGDGFRSEQMRPVRKIRSTRFTAVRYAYGLSTVLQQATFFRSALIKSVHFNEGNRTCWDGEILVDIALSGGRLVHVPQNWGLFEVHPGSITGSGKLIKQYWADHRLIAGKILNRRWRPHDELVLRSVRVGLRARNLLYRLCDQDHWRQQATSEFS
jgi:glycosyltransferase involved in cell wall biosynthesis